MKKVLSIIFAFLVLNAVAQQKNEPFKLPKDVVLTDINGLEYKLSETLQKKALVLDFWATWCGPCILKYDSIKDLVVKWKEETGVEIIIISIDTDDKLPEVKKMVAEKEWPFKVLLDPKKEVFKMMNEGNEAIPQSFFFDSMGALRFKKSGIKIKMSKDSKDKKLTVDHTDYYDKIRQLR